VLSTPTPAPLIIVLPAAAVAVFALKDGVAVEAVMVVAAAADNSLPPPAALVVLPLSSWRNNEEMPRDHLGVMDDLGRGVCGNGFMGVAGELAALR
jgi:hypothetical protein